MKQITLPNQRNASVRHFIQSLVVVVLSFVLPISTLAQKPSKVYKQAKTAFKAEQYDSAIKHFSAYIVLQPDDAKAYDYRAKAYEHLNFITEAAYDYYKASGLKSSDKYLSFHAGRLLHDIGKDFEAIRMLNISINTDRKYLPSYLVKIEALIRLKNYQEALSTCDQALEIKKTAENYFKHGIISVYLKNDVMAEADFRKSIRMDGSYKYPYVGLAQVLSRQNQNDAALSYCNMVLDMYPDYGEAYIVRGGIYYLKSDLLNAISDVSRAINLDSKSDSLYMIRARYNYEIKKPNNSIDDYSKAVALNDSNYMAYFRRAGIYEELKNMNEASADYARFLRLTEHNPTEAKNVRIAKEKIYNLNAETDKPFITLVAPKLNADGNIEVALNASTLLIDGIIRDASTIDNLKIKGDSYAFDKPSNEVFFTKEVSIANDEYISLTATDIYYNISNKSYKIVRTEIDPPVIDVLTPYTSDYREIFLESIDPTFYIEGKIADQSLIKMITINGIEAKFLKDTKNPHFSSTVNIEGKESIIIQALDIYGNKAETTYKLNRESAQILAGNPMGKTWVIFIDNSDYQSFTSLDGPSKDIATMKASLSKYDIHNVIEKKNMTKTQMEKFFALELRDYVKNQKVNSLMVWYAGHGKFINETGYWIPVDAKRDEEFTYFNINSLKAFMQSYTNFVTHVLVVTDACESGPSFYAAMRGSGDRECGDSIPKTFKSSQVFSSAGYELAADNSPFTKTFAKSLDYNTNSCIPIDKIVTNVSNSVGQGSKQSPKFGKIQGLEDEDGTFFFIKKSH